MTRNVSPLLNLPLRRAAYSDRTSWYMARCSELAYTHFEDGQEPQLRSDLKELDLEFVCGFAEDKTCAFLACNDRFAVLAFRGTEANLENILSDIDIRFHSHPSLRPHRRLLHLWLPSRWQRRVCQPALEGPCLSPGPFLGHRAPRAVWIWLPPGRRFALHQTLGDVGRGSQLRPFLPFLFFKFLDAPHWPENGLPQSPHCWLYLSSRGLGALPLEARQRSTVTTRFAFRHGWSLRSGAGGSQIRFRL